MVEMDKNVNRDDRGCTKIYALGAAIAILCLAACSGNPPAPVEERRVKEEIQRHVLPAPEVYIVKSGDTLYAIAFRFGLDYAAVASWNQLESTNLIQPGQRLVMRPPPAAARATAKKPPANKPPARGRISSRPYEPPPAAPRTSSATKSTSTANKTPARPPSAVPATTGAIAWQWPAGGKVIQSFKAGDPTRPGLNIGGTEGQAIQAAAAGLVVYSGNGLIGYGELIIIKHNDRLLSAYAHNRKRLVQENDSVRAGQKIAEMGRNGSNRVMLHFEIREHGSPVDPMRHLPRR